MKYKALSKYINMIKLSLKIWSLANLTLFAVLLVATNAAAAFQVLVFSLLFSLPALLLLYLLLEGLHFIQAAVRFYWLMLLLGTAAIAVVPCLLLNVWLHDADVGLDLLLPLAAVSAYAGVVFVSPSLHELFISLRYADND